MEQHNFKNVTTDKKGERLTRVTVAQLPFFKKTPKFRDKKHKIQPLLKQFKRGLFFKCNSKF